MTNKRKATTSASNAGGPAKKTRAARASTLEVIPSNKLSWTKCATAEGVKDTSINDLTTLNSGSRVTDAQFLTFRVIWPGRKGMEALKIPNEEKADEIIEAMNPWWQRYIKHMKDGKLTSPSIQLGTFQTVRSNQQKVENALPKASSESESQSTTSETPAETDSRSTSPSQLRQRTPAADSFDPEKQWIKTKDEQIVNDAIISYLDVLTLNIPGLGSLCSSERLRLLFEFKAAQMEARTGGFLGIRGKDESKEAFATIEAKAAIRQRSNHHHGVYKEESAQTVLLIAQDSKNGRFTTLPRLQSAHKHQRLPRSQDRHEIFIVIASYDDDYVRYLKKEDPQTPSFMVMQEYGPFIIGEYTNMQYLAQFIVGFCLEVNERISMACPKVIIDNHP
ncbi:uncharacterized protein LDX57_007430 [Aspergillus melleus]|uniref:uncharacterized protein n=1 Tax=Aspergillus melleus TaxID=138277 RepID=UPI001E8CC504|nr:uncharacterized protein LDX57_007430 [Aspergillus melleus]KAH8429758.1 hypothetical protein LDX57_007430 [Aspergillus melleus]